MGGAHLRDNSHLSKVTSTATLNEGHTGSQAQTVDMVSGNWAYEGGLG